MNCHTLEWIQLFVNNNKKYSKNSSLRLTDFPTTTMAEAKHAAQILNSREEPPSIQINNGSLKNIKSESFTADPAKTNGLAPATSHSRTGSSDSGEGLLLSASDLQARSGGCSKSINNNNNNSFGSVECSAKDHAASHQRSEYNCCDIIDSLRNGGGEKTLTDVIKQQGMGQAGHRAKSTTMSAPTSCDHGLKGLKLLTLSSGLTHLLYSVRETSNHC